MAGSVSLLLVRRLFTLALFSHLLSGVAIRRLDGREAVVSMTMCAVMERQLSPWAVTEPPE